MPTETEKSVAGALAIADRHQFEGILLVRVTFLLDGYLAVFGKGNQGVSLGLQSLTIR